MTISEIVMALREEAGKNKVANDVFTVWAMRERSRAEVTLNGLMQRMVKEGFNYSPEEYAPVLRTLARLGLGQLYTSGNKVKALKSVKWTLKSIGEAALNQKGNLKSFRIRNKYRHLIGTVPAAQPAAKPIESSKDEFIGIPVSLTVQINGKNIVVPIPRELSAEEVGALVTRFQVK